MEESSSPEISLKPIVFGPAERCNAASTRAKGPFPICSPHEIARTRMARCAIRIAHASRYSRQDLPLKKLLRLSNNDSVAGGAVRLPRLADLRLAAFRLAGLRAAAPAALSDGLARFFARTGRLPLLPRFFAIAPSECPHDLSRFFCKPLT